MTYDPETWKDFPQTKQEIFDKVAEHLLTQRKMSGSFQYCRYLEWSGSKCAAGCLIPTAAYKESLEGKSWRQLVSAGTVPAFEEDFVMALQCIHDNAFVKSWFSKLKNLCVTHKLEWKFEHLRKETDEN